jgi:hypothetical protein
MNEQQIRDALRGVAEAGGEPGADAAWDEVCRGIAADRTSRSRRVVLGGAVVAIAAAAAAFALVPNLGDDEAVRVGPSDQPTVPPTTTEPQPDEEVGSGARVPAHPMAVVVQDGNGQRLDLYDADTGALLQRELARADRITNVSIKGAGLTYTEEGGATARVRIMTYDAGRLPFTHTSYIFGNERSGVGSEGTMAFVEQGVTPARDRILLWHEQTGTKRYLEWAPGEEDVRLTDGRIDDLAFSPDGTRLAFVSSYEGEDDIRVINLTATSLSESRLLADAATDPSWTDDDGILAVQTCCITDPPARRGGLIWVVGSIAFDRPEDDAVNIAINGGILAVVSTDGTLEVGSQEAGSLRPFAIDGTVVDVGL